MALYTTASAAQHAASESHATPSVITNAWQSLPLHTDTLPCTKWHGARSAYTTVGSAPTDRRAKPHPSRSTACLPKTPIKRRHPHALPLLAESSQPHPQNPIVKPVLDTPNTFTGMYTVVRTAAHDVELSINIPKQRARGIPNWM